MTSRKHHSRALPVADWTARASKVLHQTRTGVHRSKGGRDHRGRYWLISYGLTERYFQSYHRHGAGGRGG